MDTQQQKLLNVLVVGDSCVDFYHYGTCDRLSPEAPVPILKLTHTERKSGMALNVKKNLEAFDVDVDIITNDEVITKERFIDIRSKNQLLRFDTGETNKLIPLTHNQIEKIDYTHYDAVAIVDYNKGFISKRIASSISRECSNHNLPLFVDSKKTNLAHFSNSIIKINNLEYSEVEYLPDEYELIVTHGDKGAEYKGEFYSTSPVEVYDVCGAGDTFFASLIYQYSLTKNLTKAIKFANKCARITVTKEGTYSLTKEEIRNVSKQS